MQGWTPDFIPKITGDAVAMNVIAQAHPDPGRRGDPYEPPRYLSTPLFADVPADMTDEEAKISRSTPSAQLAA
jgi:cysteine synthase A